MSCVQQVGSTPQRKEEYNENTFSTSSKNLSSRLPKKLQTSMQEMCQNSLMKGPVQSVGKEERCTTLM